MITQWVYYIGGLGGKSGSLTAIRLGIAPDPRETLLELAPTSPFQLVLLGMERGTQDLLETRRSTFRPAALQNDWYLPQDELVDHIEGLEAVNLGDWRLKKVCLDLNPEEWIELEAAVKETGTVTKARLIRRAVKFYAVLGKYKARGFLLQAIKKNRFVVFSDLDNIPHPDEVDL